MSCDFVDGEDASIALQSLVVALSFPLHCWLGASALHPAIDRDEDANDSNPLLFVDKQFFGFLFREADFGL